MKNGRGRLCAGCWRRCASAHLRSGGSRNDYYFRDGAGAVVLGASEEPGIISTHLHADGSYGELLTLPNADRVDPENPIYLTMAGNEVFKVAVTELAHIVDETLAAE